MPLVVDVVLFGQVGDDDGAAGHRACERGDEQHEAHQSDGAHPGVVGPGEGHACQGFLAVSTVIGDRWLLSLFFRQNGSLQELSSGE